MEDWLPWYHNRYHDITILIMVIPCGRIIITLSQSLSWLFPVARKHCLAGDVLWRRWRSLPGFINPVGFPSQGADSQISNPCSSSKERFPDFQFMQQLCAEMMCQGWDLPGDCSQNEPLCQRPLPAGGDMCNTLHLFARGWLKIKWIFSIMQPLLAAVH